MNATSITSTNSMQSKEAPRRHGVRPSLLSWSIMLAVGAPPAAVLAAPAGSPAGDALEFSAAFTASSQTVDISRFERGNPVLPGSYNVDVFVNDGPVARKVIRFHEVEGSQAATPCFDYATLVQMGVDVAPLDPQVVNPQSTCISIHDISSDATATMDVGQLRLDVSIPQESLKRQARGYVSPELWDQGETAMLVGYNFNAYSLNQDYSGPQQTGYGTALAEDGSLQQVQGSQYYVPGPGGSYVASSAGNYMLNTAGQYVPVQRGSFSPAPSGGHGSNDLNAYLGLDLGLNVGGWRVRSQQNLQWDERTGKKNWTNVNTTATHDITPWKAQLTVGDSFTQGTVFDTTAFRGLTVYSDDRMVPDSQHGYAPVVRGTAKTQARVEVRQNGSLLYHTTVAPGPFVIDDLYATGYGGDLAVSVFEADGSVNSFVVPYSAVPMLLRPGVGRWSVTDGEVRNDALRYDKPFFLEGTYQRGINNWLTVYGGVQSTYHDLYRGYVGGAAVNTGIGAVSLDVTKSRTSFTGAESMSGYSYRASYSKAIPTSGTTFALATYRYSNGNYLSLSDAAMTQDMMTSVRTSSAGLVNTMHQKQRLNVTINQDFGGKYGQMYFDGSRNTYWSGMTDATTYQIGYSNTFKRLNIGINASRTALAGPGYNGSRFDNQFGLNVSIPLGGPSSRNAPQLSLSATRDDLMGNNNRAGVTGTFGKDSQYNYGANLTYSDYFNSNAQTSASGTLGWQAPYANLNGSYSYASHYQQASVSASGGMVAHGGGITLSPQLDINSPIGIVHAPDAKGARVSSSGQATVDGRGYAVVTSLTPYRMNDVTLDPVGTSSDVELQTTRLQTAPRAGAVVPLKFETTSGRAVLIHATQANGDPIPFGADVLDGQGKSVGTVAQGGQLFARGAEEGGELTARWGDGESQQCRLRYSVPVRAKGEKSTDLTTLDAVCR
ncbi:fimbria/pilus outer membrane usher protein [Luteibacter sp.]|uniref:fimbria/pilus outer membrane usher protein n=1 Tax=Luteibacter sp. TaxID=1886636 RepID=UPI0028082117|nr:fimbria/pilus outer membrane usher protein [Luteibacter sp.]MDQ8051193.1 fimbria/pilus outer membrane usher protein [Luteibacter sp.]